MKSRLLNFLLFTFSLSFFIGCTSFTVKQSNSFINEDGQIMYVQYGVGNSEYVTKFKSPMNGREMEFKSKLRVRLTLPDGRSFFAFQCMNELPTGTMYVSSDEQWSFLANGFTCTLYKLNRNKMYAPVFSGVVCQSPEKPRKEQRR